MAGKRDNVMAGTKRPAASTDPMDSSDRKRSPYTSRACDACRKRKGNAQGAILASIAWGAIFNALTPPLTIPLLPWQLQRQAVHSPKRPGHPMTGSPDERGSVAPISPVTSEAVNVPIEPVSYPVNTPRRKSRRFYGPTSPEYSLNVAQSRMRSASTLTEMQDVLDPARIDDSESEADESSSRSQVGQTMVPEKTLEKLLRFREMFSHRGAIQLLDLYQEINNDFYPIVNMETARLHLDIIYDWPKFHVLNLPNRENRLRPRPFDDEDSLLILNLIITIAQCVVASRNEITAQKNLYSVYKSVVDAKLVSAALGIKRVVIALLVGIYHYFIDKPRLSWRMCGTAGQMLMELGVHNREGANSPLDQASDHDETMAITCSTVILDRQWSVATGLPTHFHLSHFFNALETSSIQPPYLKAMIFFIRLSDKFRKPLSQIGTRNSSPEDDEDAFDIINYQVE
ncbi:hypothetical protein G7054_g12823 [Neopestalotiopsis clavispora]|nr:hypothetical protein G7054_g12823 [Neopestalotiopsis clavispora]